MPQQLRRYAALAYLALSEVLLRLLGRRRPYGILKLALPGALSAPRSPARLLAGASRRRDEYLRLLSTLRWARADPLLRAVFITCGPLRLGWAQLQELRRGLVALRDAGKLVWVYCAQAGIHEYLLASAAHRIVLAPAGTLDVAGLSSEVTFVAGALQKLGIEAEFVQMGKYKSAAECFTRSDMSAAHREMLESLIGDLYAQIVDAVACGRGLEPARARELLDRGPFVAREAHREGLVDALSYEDEAEAQLSEQCDHAAAIEWRDYFARHARSARRQATRYTAGAIGLLQLGGTIKMGDSISGADGMSATGADGFSRDLRELRERSDIRAVVVRISSPGGSGLASDLIWHEVTRTRQVKPVVVSFGDVAASGGYYIGVAGRPIIAEGGTITGSIGVLAGKALLRGLYDRLGVTKDIVGHGRHTGLHSDYLPLGDEERQLLRSQAEFFYEDFVGKVAADRQLEKSAVEAAAQGRVWTGRQAHALGLVDQLGGLERALEEAKAQAGFRREEPVAVESYPKPQRFWNRSFNLNPARRGAAAWVPWLRFVASERLWAILPVRLRFF